MPEQQKKRPTFLDLAEMGLPIDPVATAPPIAPPPGVDDPYNTKAQEYFKQAQEAEARANAPAIGPKGFKEHLVSGLRSFMEGMSRPQDPFYMERERGQSAAEEKKNLTEHARQLLSLGERQQQMGETARLRKVQEDREARETAEFEYDKTKMSPTNMGNGTVARVPQGGTGSSIFEHDPNFVPDTKTKTDTRTEDMKEFDWVNAAASPEEKAGRIKFLDDQANRRRQMTNPLLDASRNARLNVLTKATPGQVIHTATGYPVDLAAGESILMKDVRQLIDQNKHVGELLKTAGDTGAIKGWVTVQGMTLPVLQDNLPVEYAELQSEIQRLVNAYVYANSGKAISENEMVRTALTAPNIKYSPEVNQKLLQNFQRTSVNAVNTLMEINGWSFMPGQVKPAMTPEGSPAGVTRGTADPAKPPVTPQTPPQNQQAPAQKRKRLN